MAENEKGPNPSEILSQLSQHADALRKRVEARMQSRGQKTDKHNQQKDVQQEIPPVQDVLVNQEKLELPQKEIIEQPQDNIADQANVSAEPTEESDEKKESSMSRVVKQLYEEAHTPIQIAHQLGLPLEEVNLLLSLSDADVDTSTDQPLSLKADESQTSNPPLDVAGDAGDLFSDKQPPEEPHAEPVKPPEDPKYALRGGKEKYEELLKMYERLADLEKQNAWETTIQKQWFKKAKEIPVHSELYHQWAELRKKIMYEEMIAIDKCSNLAANIPITTINSQATIQNEFLNMCSSDIIDTELISKKQKMGIFLLRVNLNTLFNYPREIEENKNHFTFLLSSLYHKQENIPSVFSKLYLDFEDRYKPDVKVQTSVKTAEPQSDPEAAKKQEILRVVIGRCLDSTAESLKKDVPHLDPTSQEFQNIADGLLINFAAGFAKYKLDLSLSGDQIKNLIEIIKQQKKAKENT